MLDHRVFSLSFPPGHRTRLIFSTRGILVSLEDGAYPQEVKGLLAFLKAPPSELSFLLKVLGSIVEMQGGLPSEDGKETKERWPQGVRVDFPSPWARLKGLWQEWTKTNGKNGPFTFSITVAREGKNRVETQWDLAKGCNMITLLYSGAEALDLKVHKDLMSFFFALLDMHLRVVVKLLRVLRTMGLILL